MTVAVILQVRLDSTRLSRKALLPLGDATLTHMACRALAGIRADRYLIATEPGSVAELSSIAADCGFELIVGPKDDVLERFCLTAEAAGADLVIRGTGDNPLVSAELAELLLERRAAADPDYCHFIGPPLGTGVEIIKASALFAARVSAPPLRDREGRIDPAGSYSREHVTPFLYRNPDTFSCAHFEAPHPFQLPDAKVTVDTQSDYDFVARIFQALYTGKPIPIGALVEWLRAFGNGIELS
jgi:spore coat polysaccharide biosynthesis protein SpsF